MKLKHLQLITPLVALLVGTGAAFADVRADFNSALALYNQKKYAAAAAGFEMVIKKQPTSLACYYAALANQSNHQELRARQLFQYIVTTYPSSTEADYSRKILAKTAPAATAGSATASSAPDELPESVKKLIPKDMQAMLDTPAGKLALKQMMKDKADELATIRKAETAGVLKQDQLSSAVESAGLMTAHTNVNLQQPFTAADIAQKGAAAIDQMIYPNCWFEASMASLAELPRGQRLLASMIKMKDQDKYVVRFPGDGVEYVITNKDLMAARINDSALWASLIECAQLRKFPHDRGGYIEVGLGSITGCKAETISPAGASVQEISSFIGGAVKSQNPVVAGTNPYFGDLPVIVFPGHAYTVISLDTTKNMITLRNPHGNKSHSFSLDNDPRHDQFEQLQDGLFKISIPMFQKYFNQLARSFI